MSGSAPVSNVLRALAEGTAAATGDEFFRSLAKHAALALGARYAFAAETLNELESRSLAYWEGTGFGEGFSYRFPGTPCQRVAAGHVCSTPTNIQRLYPDDVWLQQIGADSYIGVPMRDATGTVLGHIAVLHTEPLEPTPEQLAILQIFAARGCAELARVRSDRALREAMSEVQRLRDRLQAENIYLQEEIRDQYNFEQLIGQSAPWQRLVQEIEVVAGSDSTVLIVGETGTGKELIARALHARSSRRDRPLVKVNCGAISAGLVESELFGHHKGAFTGALQNRVGRFELADGGTLFLDEIGELPLETQVKLLRALQEQEFEPVGSNETVRVNVRVLAATNRNLEQAIAEGRFRADLYYRLNVIPLRVPALRERRADINQLAMYFLQRCAKKSGKAVRGIATTTLEHLKRYDWPGNVRELENVIERGVVLSSGPLLELDTRLLGVAEPIPPASTPSSAPRSERTPATDSMLDATNGGNPESASSLLEEVERRHILAALERTGWVLEGAQGAARLLNLTPSTARSRMKRLGITRAARQR
ncbi:MAG TPA: sigma 54-interacting transcriptional regulator [Polyangiaceae bacterium]|nr:sigma 54-interacting transcriptional regulator [Polyangiaceae bacterium]